MQLKHSDGKEDSESLNQLFQGSAGREASRERDESQVSRGRPKSKDVRGSDVDFAYSQTDHNHQKNNYSLSKAKNLNAMLSDRLEPIEEVLDPRLYGIPERVDVEGELRR